MWADPIVSPSYHHPSPVHPPSNYTPPPPLHSPQYLNLSTIFPQPSLHPFHLSPYSSPLFQPLSLPFLYHNMENNQISTTLQMQSTTSNAIIQTNHTHTHTHRHKPISLKPDPSTTENLTKHTLIGKLILAKDINYNRIIAIIQKAWKHTHGLSIASLSQNTFLFKFTTENDLLQTISSSP